MDKATDPQARAWYVSQAVQHGWPSAVLTYHIASGATRLGAAPNNFPTTLPPVESNLVAEVVAGFSLAT